MNKLDLLLLLQIGGLYILFSESEDIFSKGKLRAAGAIFVLMLPTILYVNLSYLGIE
jgi:hypothetical protein